MHSASPPRREADGPLTVSEATWDAMVNTNVRSGFFLARELGRRMQGRRRHQGPHAVHHLAARRDAAQHPPLLGLQGRADHGGEGAGPRAGPAGIRVNALAPGAVPGGGFNAAAFEFDGKIPLGRLGTAEDMANMALALLSDRFSGYVTGTTVAVDGGIALYNWIPLPRD